MQTGYRQCRQCRQVVPPGELRNKQDQTERNLPTETEGPTSCLLPPGPTTNALSLVCPNRRQGSSFQKPDCSASPSCEAAYIRAEELTPTSLSARENKEYHNRLAPRGLLTCHTGHPRRQSRDDTQPDNRPAHCSGRKLHSQRQRTARTPHTDTKN